MTAATQTKLEEVPTGIRPMEQGDLSFVFATWLQNYKHFSFFAKRIPNDTFFQCHHNVIANLLTRSKILVIHDLTDPTLLFGWICYEDQPLPVVHYIYIKKSWRSLGMGQKLFKASGLPEDFQYSHATFDWWSNGDTKGLECFYPAARYNPYLIA